jgi:hypothetical protein
MSTPLQPCRPAGQPVELCGDPFKPSAAIKQEQQDTPSDATAAAGTSPAAAAAGACPKRFSDDTPAGPDVAASPATGWAEVYGGDVDEEAAAAAADQEAAAADGSSGSPAAAAGVEGVAGGVEGLGAQQGGEVPFFFMDAYEAPERPGVFASCCLFVVVFPPL